MHKVAELEGPLLDAAVAKAEGITLQDVPMVDGKPMMLFSSDNTFRHEYKPSALWALGGPIIERERMVLRGPDCVGDWGEWSAYACGAVDGERGPTALIAAMRAFVAAKLGDEVELP